MLKAVGQTLFTVSSCRLHCFGNAFLAHLLFVRSGVLIGLHTPLDSCEYREMQI